MALQMAQLPSLFPEAGLGQANIVAAIVGPLAVGGADAYRTYAESSQGKKELKQRQREFTALSRLYERQQIAAERQQALYAVTSLRRAQISSASQAGYAPYLLGAVAIGGLALVAIAMARRGRG